MEQNEFQKTLRMLIGGRSINQVAEISGVPKANISRWVNGKYVNRPSVKQLSKLVCPEAAPQNGVDFRKLMYSAGYSGSEIESYLTVENKNRDNNPLEKAVIWNIQKRLIQEGIAFRTEPYIASSVHGVRIFLDEPRKIEWIILFALSGGASFEVAIGRCALLPFDADRKISIVMEGEPLPGCTDNSLRGNVSLITVNAAMDIKAEITISSVSGVK